ncbi:hypothetical protein BISA_1146 [Bifidobacterium saguini DSM 23967]|uniref:Beta-carotene 15,15'-monooxygenase n=3 Tax=Bifidobacterium TaxID=1678 RepID=A0A2N5ITE5_9BIFI|nr:MULTISPECIES: DUF6020 family protein [Bifidobacterium]KFI91858.1 hypothetical protein BISA_1146 [Bifidobacterium saguini DSM 23967]PLS25236.1 hypothetical protein Tam1G_0719 [Bifidobacterium imperatoris]QSY58753.1 hypothetical protein BLI708_02370 [Bifidobacterium imperatoris]QTB90132.1 hypothetical protein BSD967_07155 [Bifidobacterium saguini]
MTSPAISKPAAAANPTKSAISSRPHTQLARLGTIARWTLAVLACLWLSLCTAVGPLYWDFETGTIAHWNWANTAIFIGSFVIYFGIIVALVRFAAIGHALPAKLSEQLRTAKQQFFASAGSTKRRHDADNNNSESSTDIGSTADAATSKNKRKTRFHISPQRIATAVAQALLFCQRWIIRGTNRFWKLLLVFFIGWLWVPTTLLAAFGADVRSQIREFSWAWNQWTGLKQPYIGFFSFVPMDIYPTAHYMWPSNPTYLTDQHNIVLTLIYGATAAFSRYVTGSNDAGIVVLAALQMLFAVFCCAAAAHRFLNRPWLSAADTSAYTATDSAVPQQAGGLARFLILLFFMVCPLAVFATISLTKSPLFAFAFVWWFGIWYELTQTWRPAAKWRMRSKNNQHHAVQPIIRLPRHSFLAFIVSTAVMLISAKYAWYIIALQIVLALIADRRRWATYVAALLIPTVLIHGGISYAISSNMIIGGDPIESRGVQLQMIARVAQRNPDGISNEAMKNLSPVFNKDQMADAYFQQDADPVKSSGIQAKKVSYKWRTVTPEDMANFNTAWLDIIKDNPVIALDALLAKCFGYFNVTDLPYVSMDYYVSSDYVQKNSAWIKYYNHDWREQITHFTQSWGKIPVIGWPTHGNFYVVLTLLIGAAEVIRRRWLTLMTHIPLLLLMGVMITAPANNFERHMLPVAFVFGFVVLTYWRESRAELATAAASTPMMLSSRA